MTYYLVLYHLIDYNITCRIKKDLNNNLKALSLICIS